MSTPVLGRVLGKKICDVFGLDADKVQSININIEADGFAIITVGSYVHEVNMNGVEQILEEYELVERVKKDAH